MSLKDRLQKTPEEKPEQITTEETTQVEKLKSYDLELKEKLCTLLAEKINTTPIWDSYDDAQQDALIKQFVEHQLVTNFKDIVLNKSSKIELISTIINDARGYEPLTALLEDTTVSQILVNGINKIYINQNSKLLKTDLAFKDKQHLINIIRRIVAKSGQKFDEKATAIDILFPNGTCVNAILSSGPYLSITKCSKAINLNNLLQNGFLTKEISEVLVEAVKAQLNIVISGKRCSGKTTLLKVLSEQIPNEERIITIENHPELALKQENLVKLQANGTSSAELLENALKLSPDRIILGQCIGAEALNLLQVMNAGAEGTLTTLYATSVSDTLSRLETLSLLSGLELPERNIKAQIASAINLIIHVDIFQDGSRKISSVSEIVGIKESEILINELFKFEQTGFSNSKITGTHISTGIKPEFIKKLGKNLPIPAEYFDKTHKHTAIKIPVIKSNNDKKAGIRSKLAEQKSTLLELD